MTLFGPHGAEEFPSTDTLDEQNEFKYLFVARHKHEPEP